MNFYLLCCVELKLITILTFIPCFVEYIEEVLANDPDVCTIKYFTNDQN